MREKTNIVVKILDLSPLLSWIFERVRNTEGLLGLSTPFDIGYVQLENGDIYVLDGDGCGPAEPISDKTKFRFDVYPDYAPKIGPDGKQIISLTGPLFVASLDRTQVISLPVKKEVDLSEFIRTFGNRLERNFREWVHVLTSPAKTQTTTK